MNQKEYHAFIKKIQEKEFPGAFNEYGYAKEDDGKQFFFGPSHHFEPSTPLMTEEIVDDLKENKKKLLSVGCGPAYLERLLVSKLGVKPKNITLADISDKYVLNGFEFYKFDMHKDWPNLGKTFDYIIFPESPLINVNFSGNRDHSFKTFRQPDREEGLYRLLVRSLNVLNSPGNVRLTCGVAEFVKAPVKKRLEAEFQNVQMGYSGELTYLTHF